jgi:hypothetical protein
MNDNKTFAARGVLFSLPRWSSPRVQAKIDAIGLVEVALPC